MHSTKELRLRRAQEGCGTLTLQEDVIESIVYAGEQEVWTLGVKNNQTYVADGIAVHNCQNFDASLEPELMQVLKAAKRPTVIYAGTSTIPETMLEAKYQESSKGVWMIPSGIKGKWFSLNDPDILDKIITVHGLACPYTGKLVNPLIGEFVHEDATQEAMGNVGFHTPQIIVPEYCEGDKWLEIYNDFKSYPRDKFLQEVMGIPVEGGQREISEGDLKAACMDISLDNLAKDVLAGRKKYRYIISGCDWGGSDYNPAMKTKVSFTVHVMIGITPIGEFELFHVKRYSGMDYQDIGASIVADHTKYKGFALGSDFGMGMYYNNYLQQSGRIPYERHFIWNYTSGNHIMQQVKTDGALLNHISLNKTETLSALFSEIRRKGGSRIRFPNWTYMRDYLMDFLNSYRTVTDTASGRGSVRYMRHGSKSDDVLHATNFAVCVGRLILNEDLIDNPLLRERVRGDLGLSSMSSASQFSAIGSPIHGDVGHISM